MTKGFIRQPGYNDTIICLGSSNDFFIDENALFFGWSMMVFFNGLDNARFILFVNLFPVHNS